MMRISTPPSACCREMICHSRSLEAIARVVVLAFGCLSAQAHSASEGLENWNMQALGVSPSVQASGQAQGALDRWGAQVFGLVNCASVLDQPEGDASVMADCVRGRMVSALFNTAFLALDEHGKALFGSHFHLDHRLNYSTSGGGISGELDAVIPMNSFTSVSEDQVTRALFLQNGLSSYKDQHGFRRHDMRFGVVHRIANSVDPDAGVFGTSLFFQENIERGHVRIVTGLEYTDWWGRGTLSHFMPATDWRTGRFGHEERALEGVEFELRSEVTNAIELTAAAGRWEDRNLTDDWITRGRLGIQWQPHPWVGLRGNWEEIGTADDSLGLYAVVAIPFDGNHAQRSRWRGLGRRNLDSSSPDSGEIWNAVGNISRIEVAERQTPGEEEHDDGLLNSEPQPSLNQMSTGT